MAEEEEEEAPSFKPFVGPAVRLDGKPLKKTQLSEMETDGGGGGGGGSGGSGGRYQWGDAAGSIKTGNVAAAAAAERRAAMAAAAERRSGGASALSAAAQPPTAISPTKVAVGAPTKWSKSAKMGRFQAGSGNKLG